MMSATHVATVRAPIIAPADVDAQLLRGKRVHVAAGAPAELSRSSLLGYVVTRTRNCARRLRMPCEIARRCPDQ